MIILLFLLIAIIWGVWYFSRFVKQKERKLYEFSLVTGTFAILLPLGIKYEEDKIKLQVIMMVICYIMLIGKWFIDNGDHN